MEQHPIEGESRFGCYLIPSTSRFSDIARVVECQVFGQYFGNTAESMVEQYGPYEQHSLFLVVVDRELRCAAGAMRVITDSKVGLKSLNDISAPPLGLTTERVLQAHAMADLSRCWDIATLAVLKQYRGAASDHMVSVMLYAHLFSQAVKQRIDHVVTILDNHAYVQLTQLLGLPFVPIADSSPFTYLGVEDSRASYGYVPSGEAAVEAHLQRMEPAIREVVRPYADRLLHCEGMPALVEVHESERTSTVRIAPVHQTERRSVPPSALAG